MTNADTLKMPLKCGILFIDVIYLINKWIGIVLLLSILAIAVVMSPISIPKQQKINNSFKGVMYQLGEENPDYIEPVEIHVDGKLKRDILGKHFFKGVIDIDEGGPPIPREQRKIDQPFYKTGSVLSTPIVFAYVDRNGRPHHDNTYGMIHINKDFSKITIIKRDDEGYWYGKDGLMISAPAINREQALEITNELAGVYFNYEFK